MFLILAWLMLFIAGLGLISERDPRYIFPLLIPGIVMAVLGMSRVLEVFFKRLYQQNKIQPVIFCILFIFYLGNYLRFNIDMTRRAEYFTGYREAGEVIRQIGQGAALIMAASLRQIRYYSGINLKEFGGEIIPFLQSSEEFKKIVEGVQGDILLEMDIWERLQPEWRWNNGGVAFLDHLGFELVHTVYQPLEGEKSPVIQIFRKSYQP
jgi:hypothetical protein